MITLPQITAADNWNGTSEDPNQAGVEVTNAETAMDLDEHRRIVFAAKTLFVGGQFPTDTSAAWECLRQLRTVFTTTSTRTVRISKGIHQPRTDPHLQLSLDVTIGNETRTIQFHLNVSAEDRDYDRSGDMRFTWKPVQFTALWGNVYAAWPRIVALNVKASNIRRRSIGPTEWATVKEAMEQAKVDAANRLKVQAGKAETTVFTTAWTPFKQKNFQALKALKTKPADIQAALLASNKFTEGGTTITYDRTKKTLALTSA